MARKKPIISPFGQWAYPGEVTIIPSSDITMKGVNYPVLGIDNLGNKKIMKPGNNYTFPGDVVLELPLKKQSLYNRILIKKNKSS